MSGKSPRSRRSSTAAAAPLTRNGDPSRQRALPPGVAAWHVYLQNLPADRVPSCGPGFEYIMENFALFEALGMIFQGSGECADVVWRFLGLSMPTWVIIGLGGLGIAGIWNNLRST